ncbi:unnamed protein product, partial [Symbiodinium microadriaticum]
MWRTLPTLGLLHMPDEFWNAAVEAIYADRQDYPCPDKMLRDVVVNVQVGGICKHFSDLFQDGQGKILVDEGQVNALALAAAGRVIDCVSELHRMLNAGTAKTVPVYVDSWGIKRLGTLAMRRWKAPIGALRDAEQAEADDDSPVAAADDYPADGGIDPSVTDTVPHDIMLGNYTCDTYAVCIDVSDDEDLDGEPLAPEDHGEELPEPEPNHELDGHGCIPEQSGAKDAEQEVAQEELEMPEEDAEFDVMDFKAEGTLTSRFLKKISRHVVVVAAVAGRGASCTPSPKGKAPTKPDSHDIETPEKTSPAKPTKPGATKQAKASPKQATPTEKPTVPKASPKAKAKASAKKSSDSKTKPKASPKAKNVCKKASGTPEPGAAADESTGDKSAARKRKWYSEEDRSFARRAKPTTEHALNQWTAIRDIFKSDLSLKYNSAHQDGFWMLAKPRMPKKGTLQQCIKAFVAIVLLAYWLDPKPPFCGETFDVIELYAGRARLAVLMILSGSLEGAIAVLGDVSAIDSIGHSWPPFLRRESRIYPPLFARKMVEMIDPCRAKSRPNVQVAAGLISEKPLHEIFADASWDTSVFSGPKEVWQWSPEGAAAEGSDAKEEEKAECERQAKEKAEKLREAKEKAESERLAKEKAEELRQAKEKAECERLAREKAEELRQAKEKAEFQRRAQEKAEELREAKEKAERERLAQEKAEELRQAKEKAECERLAQEKAEELRQAEEKAEFQRQAQEKAEELQQAKEKAEFQRRAQEKAESLRQAKEKAELEQRLDLVSAEYERLAKQKAEELRQAKEKRLAKEKVEELRLAKEKAEFEAQEKAKSQHQVQENMPQDRESILAEIAEHKAKKEDLEKMKAKLARLQQELADELAVTDALMQSQQAPLMPGVAKAEPATPETQPMMSAESPLLRASSQDAQDAWPVRTLFQSPTPPPAQTTPPTIPGLPPAQPTPVSSPALPQAMKPQATAAKTAAAPPAQIAKAKAPAPTSGAITKRIMRCMEPSSKGVFKVAKCIRDQFNAGGKSKEKVLELFAQCDYDPDSALVYACFETFVSKFSVEREKQFEMELEVDFEFLTKKEMLDDQHMTTKRDRLTMTEYMETEAFGGGLDMEVDLEALGPKRWWTQLTGPMYEKIRGVYGQVDECCEALQKYKAEGVLNGYTDKMECNIDVELGKCEQASHTLRALAERAPACVIGEIAEAVVADGSAVQNIREATKVDKNHSERNAHRLFNRYGLALRVPISFLE